MSKQLDQISDKPHTSQADLIHDLRATIQAQADQIASLSKKLEATHADSNNALEQAQALTHLGSWEWDVATDRIGWSDELYRMYGLKPQEREIGFGEFIGMIHPEDQAMVKGLITTAYGNGKAFEFEHRIILANGQMRHLFGLGKVIKDRQGNVLRMIGTSQDITERKRSEKALQQSDERFRAVTNATHDLVYDLDIATQEIWFNDVIQNDYGYGKHSVVPHIDWWFSHVHPSEIANLQEQYKRLLKSKRNTWSIEFQFRKADGSYTIVRNRAYVLRDLNGKPSRMVGSCQDITQQKQLDRAKDEFISLVSHQLRTPLTIIRLYGNMLTDGIAGPLSKTQNAYVNKITVASIRLIKLVSDILNISRIELNRIKIDSSPTDANALIRNCLDELAPVIKSKTATVIFTPQLKLEKTPLDATLFSEIVHNLVGNALRYGREKEGEVSISFSKQRTSYVLTVKDDGLGIPIQDQPHVFERFYRAHNAASVDSDGSGLGLYMVKLFTEAAGGKVWFDSIEGKGTSFYISFPLSGMRRSKVL
jgi:PAS domain S-box-containing protein